MNLWCQSDCDECFKSLLLGRDLTGAQNLSKKHQALMVRKIKLKEAVCLLSSYLIFSQSGEDECTLFWQRHLQLYVGTSLQKQKATTLHPWLKNRAWLLLSLRVVGYMHKESRMVIHVGNSLAFLSQIF